VGPSYSYGGMAPKTLWVPPGQWLELPTGRVHSGSGSSPLSKLYDLTEVPVFVKAGAMLPSQPVTLGETVGLASRAYAGAAPLMLAAPLLPAAPLLWLLCRTPCAYTSTPALPPCPCRAPRPPPPPPLR
jgi:hypothetical protein